ncbi:hypothetical protein DXG01_005334 [Tephrocybe rancida]|nr:hypothetical protein DXG01_005334 [Tephrocybe rancida]
MQGYLLWLRSIADWHDVEARVTARPHLRGAIANNMQVFEMLSHLGVPVWMEITDTALFALPAITSVSMQPVFLSTGVWSSSHTAAGLSDYNRSEFVHNKSLFYYPPVVINKFDFEQAGCGYKGHEDVIRYDKRVVRDMFKMVDHKADGFPEYSACFQELQKLGMEYRKPLVDLLERYTPQLLSPISAADTSHSGKEHIGSPTAWYWLLHDSTALYLACSWVILFVDIWAFSSWETDYPKIGGVDLEPNYARLLTYSAKA